MSYYPYGGSSPYPHSHSPSLHHGHHGHHGHAHHSHHGHGYPPSEYYPGAEAAYWQTLGYDLPPLSYGPKADWDAWELEARNVYTGERLTRGVFESLLESVPSFFSSKHLKERDAREAHRVVYHIRDPQRSSKWYGGAAAFQALLIWDRDHMAVYNQFSLSENRKRFVALALGEVYDLFERLNPISAELTESCEWAAATAKHLFDRNYDDNYRYFRRRRDSNAQRLREGIREGLRDAARDVARDRAVYDEISSDDEGYRRRRRGDYYGSGGSYAGYPGVGAAPAAGAYPSAAYGGGYPAYGGYSAYPPYPSFPSYPGPYAPGYTGYQPDPYAYAQYNQPYQAYPTQYAAPYAPPAMPAQSYAQAYPYRTDAYGNPMDRGWYAPGYGRF